MEPVTTWLKSLAKKSLKWQPLPKDGSRVWYSVGGARVLLVSKGDQAMVVTCSERASTKRRDVHVGM